MKLLPMKHAYIFPGQGSQYTGMGKSLYENNSMAKDLFEQANEILGFRISNALFTGTDQDLKQTNVTQPAAIPLQPLKLMKRLLLSIICLMSCKSSRRSLL